MFWPIICPPPPGALTASLLKPSLAFLRGWRKAQISCLPRESQVGCERRRGENSDCWAGRGCRSEGWGGVSLWSWLGHNHLGS